MAQIVKPQSCQWAEAAQADSLSCTMTKDVS